MSEEGVPVSAGAVGAADGFPAKNGSAGGRAWQRPTWCSPRRKLEKGMLGVGSTKFTNVA